MAVPSVAPYTTPVVALTLAIAGALLLHVPPDGVLLSVVVLPRHAINVPVIVVGNGVTVTVIVE